VNFGLLAAEICWRVWGTPANFNRFRILAVLLHGTLVVGVSQTLRHWTKGATYIRQGGHHVGQWPTFVVVHFILKELLSERCHYYYLLFVEEKQLYQQKLIFKSNNAHSQQRKSSQQDAICCFISRFSSKWFSLAKKTY